MEKSAFVAWLNEHYCQVTQAEYENDQIFYQHFKDEVDLAMQNNRCTFRFACYWIRNHLEDIHAREAKQQGTNA